MQDSGKDYSGSFTLKKNGIFYCLRFQTNGRRAAGMVQFLDEILRSEDQQRTIIKYLGFTTEVDKQSPGREADQWIQIDLDERLLETNSSLIRKAVTEDLNSFQDDLEAFSAKQIYNVLDQYDFTVRLYD